MDGALALSGHGHYHKMKRGVVKNRFRTPHVKYGSKEGKPFRIGKWKCGHRNNPHKR